MSLLPECLNRVWVCVEFVYETVDQWEVSYPIRTERYRVVFPPAYLSGTFAFV